MINKDNVLVLMIDMQEKLVNATNALKEAEVAEKFIKACDILNIPIITSEQYPKGLGHTLDKLQTQNSEVIEKTSFSVLKEKNAKNIIEKYNKKQIVLFGIETHICVYQTALDLLEQGYEVYLLKDASKSRAENNFSTSIDLMHQQGIKITCLEIVLFELLESAKNPNFKEIQALIK